MKSSRVGWIGTIVVHTALFTAAFWVSRNVAEPVQLAHAITLIAAPAPTEVAPTKSTTTPTTVKNEKTAPILKPKKVPDKPKPAPTKQVTPAVKTPPVVTPPPPPLPGVTPNVGQDVANVKIEGFSSRHQDYINNIANRVYYQWLKNGARPPLQTEVSFVIHADGSVSDIRTARSSGSYAFDNDAQAAIDIVGRARLFGPLPDGLAEMPVSIVFKPVKP